MKIDVDLNDVQTLLMDYANRHGMTAAQVHEEWKLSYRKPLQEVFETRLSRLLEAMQLHKEAMAQGDAVTANCALLRAGVDASLLSDDFGALEKDLTTAMLMDKTIIPEDYKIPEHYGFSRR